MKTTFSILILSICIAFCYPNPLNKNEKASEGVRSSVEKSLPTGIIGGKPTTIENHPYQVAILDIRGNLLGAGIIIDKYHILTTADIVFGKGRMEIKVAAGNTNYHKGKILNLIAVLIHEDFDYREMYNDIAILKLEKPIVFNEKIKKISIASETLDDGKTVTVTGWGSNNIDDLTAKTYNEGKMKSSSTERCQDAFGRSNLETIICLSGNGKAPCLYDSGDVAVAKGKAYGLFSFFGVCEVNNPGVYTNLAFYKSWIKSKTDWQRETDEDYDNDEVELNDDIEEADNEE